MSPELSPLWYRLRNAAVSYVLYLRDHFYVDNLSVYYPTIVVTRGDALAAAGVLVLVTLAIGLWCWRARSRGGGRGAAVLVGWLWFLGVMVQNIGILQSGSASRADRYTYFASIGLFLACVWLWPAEWSRARMARLMTGAVVAACIILLSVFTFFRIMLWTNPLALYLDGLARTGPNPFLEFIVGQTLQESGNLDKAIEYYAMAAEHSNTFDAAFNNLGGLLTDTGHPREALPYLARARSLDPSNPIYKDNYDRAVRLLEHSTSIPGTQRGEGGRAGGRQ
jgi:tetratricopeptide (TPR) repeat protein